VNTPPLRTHRTASLLAVLTSAGAARRGVCPTRLRSILDCGSGLHDELARRILRYLHTQLEHTAK
jgi:hypothetical protein